MPAIPTTNPSSMDGILKLEHTVPKLPVPLLASTVNQILAALKPLLTAEEYSEI